MLDSYRLRRCTSPVYRSAVAGYFVVVLVVSLVRTTLDLRRRRLIYASYCRADRLLPSSPNSTADCMLDGTVRRRLRDEFSALLIARSSIERRQECRIKVRVSALHFVCVQHVRSTLVRCTSVMVMFAGEYRIMCQHSHSHVGLMHDSELRWDLYSRDATFG